MRGRNPLAAARVSVFPLVLGIGLFGASSLAFSAAQHTTYTAKNPFPYNTSGVVDIGSDPSSVEGPAVLQFQGVTAATFNPKAPGPISLGQFVLSPTSTTNGQTTIYNDTPFEIQVQAPEFDKTSSVPLLDQIVPALDKSLNLKTDVENSLLLRGHLDGTVSANGQVSVVATIDSIKLGAISAPGSDEVTRYTFPIRYSQFILPPGFVMSTASSSVTAPTAAPDPIMSPLSAMATTSTTSSSTSTTAGTVAPAPSAFSSTTANPPTTAPLPVPAPEPSTIVFFAVVLGGVALGRRRLACR